MTITIDPDFLADVSKTPTLELVELISNTGDADQIQIMQAIVDARRGASSEANSFEISKFEIKGASFHAHFRILNKKIDKSFPNVHMKFEFDDQPWKDRIKIMSNDLLQMESAPPLPFTDPEAATQEDLETQHEVHSKRVQATKEQIEAEKRELEEQRELNSDYAVEASVESVKYLENATDMVVSMEKEKFMVLLDKYLEGLPAWSNLILNKA